MTRMLVLEVAYRGDAYAGYARQPGLDTVQGQIEQAAGVLLARPVDTVCAGRTDAGVHARGQQVGFPVEDGEFAGRAPDSIARSFTALTPPDIAVISARYEPEGFSPRFNAKSREYHYRYTYGDTPPIFLSGLSWWVRGAALDWEAMDEAAQQLVGEHDFTSFASAQAAREGTCMREILRISVHPEEQLGEQSIVMEVIGNAFLHNMVRIIAGTLAEVGEGKKVGSWVKYALEARDRRAAGQTAPPEGLVFWHVEY